MNSSLRGLRSRRAAQSQQEPAGEGAPTSAGKRFGLVRRGTERLAVIGVWAVMILVYSILRPHVFATRGTFDTIFNSQATLVFLAMALLCSFVIGEFLDLSVASIMGLSAMIVPVLSVEHHVNVVVATVVAIATGLSCGLVNAVLIVNVGVNAIVVTLGMSTFLVGIALWISDLNTISGLSNSYADMANTNLLGLPLSFYYGAAVTLVFAYILAFTPLGRNMKFVGASREVSRLAGIRVNRIRFGALVFSALISSVAGVLLAASLGGFDPESSTVYLLPAFAAVFLGTAIFKPGEFNPLGAFVGVYFLETGILGLQELGYGGWVSDIFYGAVLVVAVTISTVVTRVSGARTR